ncbi:MAG: DUF4405 domain-containing protein [Desulfovibrio sp.]
MRKIISLTALWSALILLLTSVILYIVPHGRVAYWADWSLWGLSKTQWGDIHINVGVLFIIAIIWHGYYNWSLLLKYLKQKKDTFLSQAFYVSLLVTLVFVVGTLFMVPPFSTILDVSGMIKDAATEKYGEPPYGHAELSSLETFVKKMNIEQDHALVLLKKAGIEVKNISDTLYDISSAADKSPQQLYEIMQPAVDKNVIKEMPLIAVPGTGKKSLADICALYDVHLKKAQALLKKKGIEWPEQENLMTIAKINSMEAAQLYDVLRRVSLELK